MQNVCLHYGMLIECDFDPNLLSFLRFTSNEVESVNLVLSDDFINEYDVAFNHNVRLSQFLDFLNTVAS